MKYTFAVERGTKHVGLSLGNTDNGTAFIIEIEFFESEKSRIALVDAKYNDGTVEYKTLADHEAYKHKNKPSFFGATYSVDGTTYEVSIAMSDDSYYVEIR